MQEPTPTLATNHRHLLSWSYRRALCGAVTTEDCRFASLDAWFQAVVRGDQHATCTTCLSILEDALRRSHA